MNMRCVTTAGSRGDRKLAIEVVLVGRPTSSVESRRRFWSVCQLLQGQPHLPRPVHPEVGLVDPTDVRSEHRVPLVPA